MYIPRYNLSNLYNVTCMYAFRDYLLVLDNQLMCFSMGTTLPLILIIPWLFVVLCIGLSPSIVFPHPF